MWRRILHRAVSITNIGYLPIRRGLATEEDSVNVFDRNYKRVQRNRIARMHVEDYEFLRNRVADTLTDRLTV